MHKPHIFITGAPGFVGAAMVRYFAGQDWQITASGRGTPPEALLNHARFVQADICHPMQQQHADMVVHAAALASDAASMQDLLRANLDGTRHVFEATRACKTFVFISSSSVYDYKLDIHKEHEPVDLSLLSPYGRSKRIAENWLLEQDWSDRTLIILRPRAIYGPGDRMLLPRLLRMVRNKNIVIPGNMRILSSFTHVDNLCGATEQCYHVLEQGVGSNHIFNIADPEPYEMRAAVKTLLSAVVGRDLDFRSIPLKPLRMLAGVTERLRVPTSFTQLALTSVSRNNIMDISKIVETVGFQPERNFWKTIPDIANWVNEVGLENVRKAKPILPWQV